MRHVDMTPTWGEWGNVFYTLASTGNTNAVKTLRPDMAKAFAAAEAFNSIQESLNDEQHSRAQAVMKAELHKQGF